MAAQPVLNKLLLGENILEQDITFSEYAPIWFEEFIQHLKKPSISGVRRSIILGNKWFGNKKLRDITLYEYQMHINEFSKGRAKSTVVTINMYLKKVFAAAEQYGIIRQNPIKKAVLPKFAPVKKEITQLYLTKDELLKVLDYARNYKGHKYHCFYYICLTFVYTGLRVGELSALVWGNVDFDNKTIHVDSSIYEANNQVYERQDTPKNLASIRTIPVGDTLLNALKDWKKLQLADRQINKPHTLPEDDFVFTGYSVKDDAEIPALPMSIKYFFTKMSDRKVVGEKRVHSHIFRHTHASLLAEEKVPLEVIQQRLGHSSDETTRNIYLHVTKKSQINAAAIFENYMLR